MGISDFVAETAHALRSATSRLKGVEPPFYRVGRTRSAGNPEAYVGLEATGKYVSVEGIRLHYLEAGRVNAPPIVYLHGANAYAEELFAGPLGRLLAQNHRIIAFDRPGFGKSSRLPGMAGPRRQAEVIHSAVIELGIRRPILIGHSWGGSAALAYAVAYEPELAGMVNMAGWCFPSNQIMVAMIATSLGPYMNAMRAVAPGAARQMSHRILERVFEPDPIPSGFSRFSMEVATRESQMSANAEDLKALNADMAAIEKSYASMRVPVEILVAMGDRIVEPHRHGLKLAARLPSARVTRLARHGHMAHHLDPQPFIAAVDRLTRLQN